MAVVLTKEFVNKSVMETSLTRVTANSSSLYVKEINTDNFSFLHSLIIVRSPTGYVAGFIKFVNAPVLRALFNY